MESIVEDNRLQQQMTKAQATDAGEKAKDKGDGARRGSAQRHGAISLSGEERDAGQALRSRTQSDLGAGTRGHPQRRL